MNTVLMKDVYDNGECVFVPLTDIYENDNEYIIKSEMPGVAKDGVDVVLNNNELEIKGRMNGNLPDAENLKYSEFELYNYERKFKVDDDIDSSAMSATLENGLLTIKLPKKETVKPKRIEVKMIN